jgi:hypothetical protein
VITTPELVGHVTLLPQFAVTWLPRIEPRVAFPARTARRAKVQHSFEL